MKNYNEVAESVFRRSEEVIEQYKRRRKTLTKIGVSAGCIAAAGAVGFGVLRSTGRLAPSEITSDSMISPNSSGAYLSIPNESADSFENLNNTEIKSGSGNAANQSNDINDPSSVRHFLTRISGYYTEVRDRISFVPENGTVVISDLLQKALNEYGSEDENGKIHYGILVEFYKDGKRIEPTMELWESERDKFGDGFGLLTNSSDWGRKIEHYMHADSTKEQIESYTADSELGVALFLYDDYFGYPNILDGGGTIRILGSLDGIGSIGETINDIETDTINTDYSPENGEVIIADDLKKAIDIYGEGDENKHILYNVVIEYYKDGKHIDSSAELCETERDKNPDIYFIESIDTMWGNYHIGTCVPKDKLESFKPNGEYGCVIRLHNVYFRCCE